ncbi:MAG: FtsW/RodA/SpoVE family cell cycle protein [Candidatus Woesebacteria bacterium]|jgi:rod shape determining protein RodA
MKQVFLPLWAAILAVISLLTIKSVSPNLVWRQTLYFVLGFVLFFIVSKISYKKIEKYSFVFYLSLSVLLLILLLIGKTTRGVVSWINLPGGFKFQPSQLAIPATALHLLSWLEQNKIRNFKKFLELLFIIIIPALLIFLQPDMGTAAIYLFTVGTILLLIKLDFKYILFLLLSSLLTVIMAWNFLLKDYQKQRFLTFSSGYSEEDDSAYNARQSLIAVGSGKILGRGIGFGVQSHLKFLPERQTDFIFASFAEEWGFMGSSFLLLLYTSLTLFFVYLGFKFENPKFQLYFLMIATMLLLQTGINIGMNIGLLPITGITLPLLSYGGSSVLTIFLIFALAQRMIRSQKKDITLSVS